MFILAYLSHNSFVNSRTKTEAVSKHDYTIVFKPIIKKPHKNCLQYQTKCCHCKFIIIKIFYVYFINSTNNPQSFNQGNILKMLGLYLQTLIISHKSCKMLSILNKLILQKNLQNIVTNNVFMDKK